MPMFGKTFWFKFAASGSVTFSEYVSTASYLVFCRMQKKLLPLDTVGFNARLWLLMRDAIRVEYERSKTGKIFSVWTSGVMPPQGRLVTEADVDTKLFVEGLPKLIARNVVPRIRFTGIKRRACLLILERFVTGKLLSQKMLIRYFKLPKQDVVFLLDYMLVQVRRFLYEIRSQLRSAGGAAGSWRELYEWVSPTADSGCTGERTYSAA